jgi:hypothetical protein
MNSWWWFSFSLGFVAESVTMLAQGDVYIGWLFMFASVSYGAIWAWGM